MNFKLNLLVATVFCFNLIQKFDAWTNEALIECGRAHHIDNITNLSTVASASYTNRGCLLICVVANVILPVDSIHEGKSCPNDTAGICHAGQCIGGQEDAIRECGLVHGMDFHNVVDHQGTAFTNDQCSLRCVVGGVQLSSSHQHEGSSCPINSAGVCRSGLCVIQTDNAGSSVTPKPPTNAPNPTTKQVTLPTDAPNPTTKQATLPTDAPKPTTKQITLPTDAPNPITKQNTLPTDAPKPTTKQVTLPSNAPNPPTNPPTTVIQPLFSPWMMKLLNITLVSANPPLKLGQTIYLYFFDISSQAKWEIMILKNASKMHNEYNTVALNDIPSYLTHSSMLKIQLYEVNSRLSEYHENLYALFVHFYHNRKLNFGEQEQFVAQFKIISSTSPYEKLMDLELGFAIVFDKD